ncbi:amidase domain-containing protein [Clostridium hydrogeniformans]|uniref:amidase domain-containing protein n=1 Tax=Clostridium hydrogeniformans TaxID=349933 RepID=UPI000482851C|nr:amidase domain-containing protein [Clostridium hydrogeniformans]
MNKNIKYLFLISITCIFIIIFSGFKSNDKSEIVKTIDNYFNNYFNSFKILNCEGCKDIMESNEDTLLYTALHNVNIERYKAMNISITDYEFNVDIGEINIDKNKAEVELMLNVDYHYSNVPKDVSSGMYNVDYRIKLLKKEKKWIITGIVTSFDEFNDFKNKVDRRTSSRDGISRTKAIKDVEEEEIRKIKKVNIDNEENNKNIINKKNKTDEINFRDLFNEERELYNKNLLLSYAREYSLAPLEKRLFYTVNENDCTNFTSQCIWAALGGYIPKELEKTKSNINSGANMVKGIWHGNTYGGTLGWANVEEFWRLTTGSGKGPRGIGSNNHKPYTDLDPSDIKIGDVLQVRKKADTRYRHSVVVTYISPSNSGFEGIFVSQHSYDKYNRFFIDLVNSWGNEECYIRKITFFDFIK